MLTEFQNLRLEKLRHIHFTGIKGVGMAGLAIIAKNFGIKVTGSDVPERYITDAVLEEHGIAVLEGFDPNRVDGCDLIVATGAHGGKTNPEPQRAIELGIPVAMQAQALGVLTQSMKTIAIAGTHGKTTTSAIASWVLMAAGYNPGYLIGTSETNNLQEIARLGGGTYFVAEADEYQTCPQTDPTPRFLYLDPWITVVTNVEHDHPDRYETLDSVRTAFAELVRKTRPDGAIVLCADSPVALSLRDEVPKGCKVFTYGLSEKADFQLRDIATSEGKTSWSVRFPETAQGIREYTMGVPGTHNALNATATLVISQLIGVPNTQFAQALSQYSGVKRRFERVGERAGIQVYDDYAHHPTEIRATLQAARDNFPGRRIIAVFQPHTYSRTKLLFDEFAQSFANADIALLAPIFGSAREAADPSISSQSLATRAQKSHQGIHALSSLEEITSWLAANTKSGDVVFTLGAGDIYKVAEKFVKGPAA